MKAFSFLFWSNLVCMLLVAPLQAQTTPPLDTFPEKYVTKGRAYVSLALGLNQRTAENDEQLVRTVLDQERLQFKISSSGGYALSSNLALGLNLAYSRENDELTFIDQNALEITRKFVEESVSFIPHMRNFIPLGDGTIQVFVQTDIGTTIGKSLQRDFLAEEQEKVETEFFEFTLGVRPGAVLFFDQHWAFETSVGLAGYSSRIATSVSNDDEANETRIITNSIDFQINLLTLDLGVAYYF